MTSGTPGTAGRRIWVPGIFDALILIALVFPALVSFALVARALLNGEQGANPTWLIALFAVAMTAIAVTSYLTHTARGPAAFLGLLIVAVAVVPLRFPYLILILAMLASLFWTTDGSSKSRDPNRKPD